MNNINVSSFGSYVARKLVGDVLDDAVSKLEHNEFQLERLSRMGRDPERYGIRVTHHTASGRSVASSMVR